MAHKPMILYNPTNKPIKFQWAHQTYIVEPKEKRLFDGHLAFHALYDVNTGLKVYEEVEGEMPKATSSMDYSKIPWKELVSLGGKRDVYQFGMDRKRLTQVLTELDEQEAGAL